MKERPILFSGAMVRAILSGQKTQTRRVVKLYPADTVAAPCPYGQPGDRLWVRETWQGPIMEGDEFENRYHDDPAKFQTPEYCFYAADGGSAPEFVDVDDNLRCCWRPSIHMPRWACRLVLEIVSVRVERLQAISLVDAESEGIIKRRSDVYAGDVDWLPVKDGEPFRTPVEAYRSLWQSINGPESWQANPWVWVVEFKRVQQ